MRTAVKAVAWEVGSFLFVIGAATLIAHIMKQPARPGRQLDAGPVKTGGKS